MFVEKKLIFLHSGPESGSRENGDVGFSKLNLEQKQDLMKDLLNQYDQANDSKVQQKVYDRIRGLAASVIGEKETGDALRLANRFEMEAWLKSKNLLRAPKEVLSPQELLQTYLKEGAEVPRVIRQKYGLVIDFLKRSKAFAKSADNLIGQLNDFEKAMGLLKERFEEIQKKIDDLRKVEHLFKAFEDFLKEPNLSRYEIEQKIDQLHKRYLNGGKKTVTDQPRHASQSNKENDENLPKTPLLENVQRILSFAENANSPVLVNDAEGNWLKQSNLPKEVGLVLENGGTLTSNLLRWLQTSDNSKCYLLGYLLKFAHGKATSPEERKYFQDQLKAIRVRGIEVASNFMRKIGVEPDGLGQNILLARIFGDTDGPARKLVEQGLLPSGSQLKTIFRIINQLPDQLKTDLYALLPDQIMNEIQSGQGDLRQAYKTMVLSLQKESVQRKMPEQLRFALAKAADLGHLAQFLGTIRDLKLPELNV